MDINGFQNKKKLEFAQNVNLLGGIKKKMAYKNKEDRRKYDRDYYQKNQEKIRKRKIKGKGLKICLFCGKEFFGYGNLFCSRNCFYK